MSMSMELKWIILELCGKISVSVKQNPLKGRLFLSHNAGEFTCGHSNDIYGQMSLMCQDVSAPTVAQDRLAFSAVTGICISITAHKHLQAK